MIYGINFGAPPIPDTPRSAFRKFPPRIKRLSCNHTCSADERLGHTILCPTCSAHPPIGEVYIHSRVEWFYLKGIGQSEVERNMMLVQADNGHRKLYSLMVHTVGGPWYGIYVG